MATAQTSSRNETSISVASPVSRIAAIGCVALFGLGLVWAAGFANAETLHNAAHDSRHSLTFPCH